MKFHKSDRTKFTLGKLPEHKVWNAVLDNEVDDITAGLAPGEPRQRLLQFSMRLMDAISHKTSFIEETGIK